MTDLPEACVTPCNECPWRRKSAPGWLGPFTAEEWLALVHSDVPIACHVTIPEGGHDDDWSQPGLRQCAGAAQFRANVFKSPRNPQVARAAERDEETVFKWNDEFLAHHAPTE